MNNDLNPLSESSELETGKKESSDDSGSQVLDHNDEINQVDENSESLNEPVEEIQQQKALSGETPDEEPVKKTRKVVDEKKDNAEDVEEKVSHAEGAVNAITESEGEDLSPVEEDLDEDDNENDTTEEIDVVEHDTLTKEQLVIRLKHLLDVIPITSRNLKDEIDKIKNTFDEKYQYEIDQTHEKFLSEGGEEKDFKMPPDPQEQLLSDLLNDYKRRRFEQIRKLEEDKALNLLAKQDVIEGIKELIQSEESIHTTFTNFKDLQKRWREIGPVPQSSVRNLYENYHHNVEVFYDYIKINKELRDLDLRKNLESKEKLCIVAEKLGEEENALDAFNNLQDLHKEWREIGPVPKEDKEALWERFKEATMVINKKHQQFYDNVKLSQKENLDKKTALCEKVEEIALGTYERPKVWNKKSDEIIAIQREWRSIGFAPRKFNNKVYDRFRKACDEFFNNKRKYYLEYKLFQEENLELKKALVEKAEALKESDDWKYATNEMVKIQREWKRLGPVPRKQSDIIWNKFRSACDHFFTRKKEYFKDIDKIQDTNLKRKKELIQEIVALDTDALNDDALNVLHDYKNKWNAIGHVPFKEKDAVYNEFRNALNSHFDKLNMDESKREMVKYRSKIDDIQTSHNTKEKLVAERTKLLNRLKTMESDIAVWENNIGFLSSSDKSGTVVKDYEQKIEKAKERLELLKKKVDFINDVL